MERMVELASLPGQLILDPFCGGGTTGVAALRLERQFIGLDIDDKCIAQTAARLRAADGDRVAPVRDLSSVILSCRFNRRSAIPAESEHLLAQMKAIDIGRWGNKASSSPRLPSLP
jgi:SAM-dependent methyltransferase